MMSARDEDQTLEGVVVLAGQDHGLDWKVLAHWYRLSDHVEEQELMTMLYGFDGPRRVFGSGMGGPALHPGQLIHEWRGRTDQWPYFVMARTDPMVDSVVAVSDRGTEVQLRLSAVVPEFGLRFAAAGLPGGEAPNRLLIQIKGETVADLHRPMHDMFPF